MKYRLVIYPILAGKLDIYFDHFPTTDEVMDQLADIGKPFADYEITEVTEVTETGD